MKRILVFMLLIFVMLPAFCKWQYKQQLIKDDFGDVVGNNDYYICGKMNEGNFILFYFDDLGFKNGSLGFMGFGFGQKNCDATIKIKEENNNIVNFTVNGTIASSKVILNLEENYASKIIDVLKRNSSVKIVVTYWTDKNETDKKTYNYGEVDCSDFVTNVICIRNGHNIKYYRNTETENKFFMCANCKQQMCIGARGPAGGYVFYDCDADNETGNTDGLISSECGWRYLEAAPEDLPQRYKWGDDGTFGTKISVGEGKNNTKIIFERASKERTNNAATACCSYSKNGYSDWFLPSKDELNLMCENLMLTGICSFNMTWYWSSSEDVNDSGRAFAHNLYNGNALKNIDRDLEFFGEDYGVRCIRAF